MSGLYIHIPYCHSKCTYCDFYSRPDDGRMDSLVDVMVKEYKLRICELPEAPSTVYIGGGTPSSLPDRLLEKLIKSLGLGRLSEFTIEVNPEDVTTGRLLFWKSLGIDRISMGVQSLIDDELRAVGRRHSAVGALNTIQLIQQAGFDKISCDLIYGLPLQTAKSWQQSLTTLLDTGITHLSAYSLSYEPGTRLYAMMQAGKIQPADDELVAELYSMLIGECASRGFRHYEISNFAMPGFEARHNSAYWQGIPYLGLGPSAHSFDGSCRRENPASIKHYIEEWPAHTVEEESTEDIINDTIITALRTDNGLDLGQFDPEVRYEIMRAASKWRQLDMLQLVDDKLIIPEVHWIMADAIMRDLIL